MNTQRPPTLLVLSCCACLLGTASIARADPFSFSTGNVDGLMASASQPGAPGLLEIETADDFVITSANGSTSITSATFTGLLVGTTLSIADIDVEIYRVFPNDSDVGRTSGPPTFSTPKVPTRVNSPSDVELDSRDLSSGGLSFSTTGVNPTFTANNSVKPGGIHPIPGQTTGGNLSLTGQEVLFNITFNTPFVLDPDHYFFVPQVRLTDGTFYWLSAPRPIVPPGTPFPVGFTDLQAWARDANLDPDWLRIGTDIVGGTTPPTFNMAFSLEGTPTVIPEPGTLTLVGLGLAAAGRGLRRKARSSL